MASTNLAGSLCRRHDDDVSPLAHYYGEAAHVACRRSACRLDRILHAVIQSPGSRAQRVVRGRGRSTGRMEKSERRNLDKRPGTSRDAIAVGLEAHSRARLAE